MGTGFRPAPVRCYNEARANGKQSTDMTSSGVPAQPLPRFQFDGAGLPMEANAAAWRDTVHLLFDAEPLTADETPFIVSLRTFKIGTVLFGRVRGVPMRFVRDHRVIARGGDAHVLVQFYLSGGYRGLAGGRPIDVRAGDISVLDLAGTFATEADAFENFNLLVPRALLAPRLTHLQGVHGLVLPGARASTQLLARHLHLLDEIADSAPGAEADALADQALALLCATLAPALRAAAQAPDSDIALAIRRYIDTHLADADLGVERVMRDFGVSRATLYRLFQAYGGVVGYIRRGRLQRALLELRAGAPGQPVHIGAIARRWGFGSDASFARAFRAVYGITPSEARAAVLPPQPAAPGANPVSGWLSDPATA